MEFLRAQTALNQRGVDRELGVIFGYVVAEEGPFKTGRGRFDESGLTDIVRLAREIPTGIESHWTHGDALSDPLGDFLGRSHNYRLDTSTEASRVLADLHFSETAYKSPTRGDMANYLMDLLDEAKRLSVPPPIGSSLVLAVEEQYEYGRDGKLKMDGGNNPIPPLWFPKKLAGSDIVSQGDAVTSLLDASASREAQRAQISSNYQMLVARRFPDPGRSPDYAKTLARIDKAFSKR